MSLCHASCSKAWAEDDGLRWTEGCRVYWEGYGIGVLVSGGLSGSGVGGTDSVSGGYGGCLSVSALAVVLIGVEAD